MLIFKGIVRDTLKKQDGGELRWSRTSLTMFSAWIISICMAFYDLYKNGFSYEVFIAFVGVALGSKVTDSISKKINPESQGTQTLQQ